MDKFIILDIDDLWSDLFDTHLDSRILSETKKIVDATGAAIIISSTQEFSQRIIDRIMVDLREAGLTLTGIAPPTNVIEKRADSIFEWFIMHQDEISCDLDDIALVIIDADLYDQTDDVIDLLNGNCRAEDKD